MNFKITQIALFFLIFSINQLSSQSLLWEISGNNLETPSYLFGTMHIQDKRGFEFNDSVFVKIEQCAAFAPEVNIEQTENFDEDAIFMKNKTIKDLVSDEDYKIIEKAVKENLGMEMEYVERFYPVILSTMIMETRAKHEMPEMVDAYLEKYAAEKGLKILSLEKMEDQINYFKEIPASSLMSYFKNYEAYDEYYNKMIEVYQKEDVMTLYKMAVEDSSFAEVSHFLLDERNVNMADNMTKMAQTQPTFFAIGAAHLSGENGVIQLLKNKGYSVEPIIAKKSSSIPNLAEDMPKDWVKVAPENSGFSAEFPQKPSIETSTEETPIGELKLNYFMYEVVESDPSDNFLFGVVFLDYPESFAEMASSKEMRKQMYDGAAEGVVGETGGKITREIEIEKNGIYGKEFDVLFMGDLATMTMQIFMVKNRMYMVQVAGLEMGSGKEEATQFLNSFTIKE